MIGRNSFAEKRSFAERFVNKKTKETGATP
jgi:hypothetical protein